MKTISLGADAMAKALEAEYDTWMTWKLLADKQKDINQKVDDAHRAYQKAKETTRAAERSGRGLEVVEPVVKFLPVAPTPLHPIPQKPRGFIHHVLGKVSV